MMNISRNLSTAAQKTYDLIIVGGGIYGVMLSLESARRGLRSLLIEQQDFGGATSYNSLRIVHGGFRYLQKADFHRFYESVNERRWFLKNFPDLVRPLPCLMPLYGQGLRRPPILKTALLVNDAMSFYRNQNIRSDTHLDDGKIISPQQVKQLFPQVDTEGLKGGAVWHDARMPDSQRLIISLLKWACSLGSTALNYVAAQQILTENNRVIGVVAQDQLTGETYEYRATKLVNAAGPWCRELAAQFDQDYPDLFHKSIAWNVLFDRETLSEYALAVEPKKEEAQTYFLHPWKGRLFAGTIHGVWSKDIDYEPQPSHEELQEFIDNLNLAIPGLKVSENDVLRIYSGLLPAAKPGSNESAVREVILNHTNPQGAYTVSGVKFTTSRLVSEKTINRVFPNTQPVSTTVSPPDTIQKPRGIFDYYWYPDPKDNSWQIELKELIQTESVHHLDDLVIRRTSLGDNPERAMKIAPSLCQLFDWSEARSQQEIERLKMFYFEKPLALA
jgi:glycerol-3-phosphate dehydrogenase